MEKKPHQFFGHFCNSHCTLSIRYDSLHANLKVSLAISFFIEGNELAENNLCHSIPNFSVSWAEFSAMPVFSPRCLRNNSLFNIHEIWNVHFDRWSMQKTAQRDGNLHKRLVRYSKLKYNCLLLHLFKYMDGLTLLACCAYVDSREWHKSHIPCSVTMSFPVCFLEW